MSIIPRTTPLPATSEQSTADTSPRHATVAEIAAPVSGRLWLQAAAVFCCLFFFAKPMIGAFLPQNHHVVDFHQEWLSARNFWTGRPVYGSLAEALWLHDRRRTDPTQAVFDVNAHPPAAVLVALPFGLLDDSAAFLLWNSLSLLALLLSLSIIVRELELPLTSELFSLLLCGLLVSEPLFMHFVYGQINLLILLLLTLAWWADRRQHSWMAGLCVGIAASLKFFPGFLVVYFLGRKAWRAIAAAAGGFGGLNLLTAVILGTDAFRDYLAIGFPSAAAFRGAFGNASLPALWTKCFAATGIHGPAVSLWTAPWLAHALTAASWLILSAVVWRSARQIDSEWGRNRSFGLALIGMLLASPVTWEHYFVLLLLPLLWLTYRSVHGWPRAVWFALTAAMLWLTTLRLAQGQWPEVFRPASATVWHTLWVFSLPCYALLSLFTLVGTATPPGACSPCTTSRLKPASVPFGRGLESPR